MIASPTPTLEHQQMVLFLSQTLNTFAQFFRLGKVVVSPFSVKLWPGGPLQKPDVLFISKGNLLNLTGEYYIGAPDLLIEIISSCTAIEDRVRKFQQYEKAGVREYWIIDPRPYQQQADFYTLGKDRLFHEVPLTADGRFCSTILPKLWLNVNWFRQDPLPNPQYIFTEIMQSLDPLSPELRSTFQALQKLVKS